jgi:ankyrin repeat protein
MMIDAGANLNVQDKNGNTPLHNAARFGNEEIADILIEAGADVNILNNAGKHWDELMHDDEDDE